MASSETADRLQRWRQGYEKIAEISMAQLMLLKEEAVSDDLWARMRSLNDEKEAAQDATEQLQMQLEQEIGEEKLRELFRQEVLSTAESARVLTFEASRKIELLMISTGEEIDTTRNHRKVVHAYTGISRDDEISLYFDEKK